VVYVLKDGILGAEISSGDHVGGCLALFTNSVFEEKKKKKEKTYCVDLKDPMRS